MKSTFVIDSFFMNGGMNNGNYGYDLNQATCVIYNDSYNPVKNR